MVPFIDGVADVQAFVALEADEVGAEAGGQGAGDFGFAHAGFAFQEQGAAQLECQKDGDGEAAVGDVAAVAEEG